MMKDSLFLTMKRTILGGDFNVTMDLDRVVTQPSKTQLDVLMNYDIVDMIWRIRNPDRKKFTWRQKSPIIQRRLDYWFISDTSKVDIVTAIRTDHNAITLEIDSLDDQQRGPSFWKFNNMQSLG